MVGEPNVEIASAPSAHKAVSFGPAGLQPGPQRTSCRATIIASHWAIPMRCDTPPVAIHCSVASNTYINIRVIRKVARQFQRHESQRIGNQRRPRLLSPRCRLVHRCSHASYTTSAVSVGYYGLVRTSFIFVCRRRAARHRRRGYRSQRGDFNYGQFWPGVWPKSTGYGASWRLLEDHRDLIRELRDIEAELCRRGLCDSVHHHID